MARKLGEFLMEEGQITARQLQEALRAQRIFGGSLGTHLLEQGALDEAALTAALSRLHGVPGASRPDVLGAAPEVVALLSADYARRHRAVPFRVDGDDLHVAIQNPSDTLAVHEAAFLTGFNVVPFIALEVVIRDALAQHHRLETTRRREAAPETAGLTERTNPVAVIPQPVIPQPVTPQPGIPQSELSKPVLPNPDLTKSDPPHSSVSTTAPVAAGSPRATPSAIPRGQSLAQVATDLASALDRDAVLTIALDEIAQHFPRSGVFAVRSNEAVLWRARGIALASGRTVALALDVPSVFSTAHDGSRLNYGPVAATPANQDLYTLLGGTTPRTAFVLPVHVKSRLVCVLYGDDPQGTMLPPDFSRMRRFAGLVALALEAVILRTKILREAQGGKSTTGESSPARRS